MNIEQQLLQRSEAKCELCASHDALMIYQVPPSQETSTQTCVHVCGVCSDQLEHPEKIDVHHWRCLNDSMWSQIPAVQVVAWRMLTRLNDESWSRDLLDMLYLPDDVLAWAQSAVEDSSNDNTVKHYDSNGHILKSGDTVTLTKDLMVKGAGFTAKRGTAVRGIALVANNAEQIEGRVNNQKIVILTKFVKK